MAAYGSTVVVSGRITTASGAPATGVRVRLQVRQDGTRWQRVATVVSDETGAVGASSLPVTGLAGYRWRAQGLHSHRWRLRVAATMTASAEVGADRTTVNGAAVGGSEGDAVALVTFVRGSPVVVGRGQLAADGTVSFTFATPRRDRTFVVRLAPTRDHTAARATVRVVSPRSEPSPAPSPDPSPPASP